MATGDDTAPPTNEIGLVRKIGRFAPAMRRLTRGGVNPFGVCIEEMTSPVEGIVDGRPTLFFGTNSYLGLNFDPRCIDAAAEALKRHGTGATASRVASGNHASHERLEREIAAFYGRRDAVVFSTGFLANLGVIATLAREGDAIFLDQHCHASIFDAAKLSGAVVRTFAHNDAADLDRLFAESTIAPVSTLVVVEGLYSVWGDLADLPAIVATVRRRGGVMLVDEAHSLGTIGPSGRGAAEAMDVEQHVDIIVGTFSKSIGVVGGFCVTNAPELGALRFMSRAFLFTASLPPAVVAAARAAFAIIANEDNARDDGPRATLWRNARMLHAGLAELGLQPTASCGPVGSIRCLGANAGLGAWRALLDRGVYVNLMVPPATPEHEVALRFSVSAAHTEAQIGTALAAFAAVHHNFS